MNVQQFDSLSGFLAWFTARATARAMKVRRVPLHELEGSKGWVIERDGAGRLVGVRSERGFGAIQGFEVFASGREIADWSQVLWGNDAGGPVLQIHAGEGDNRLFLIRALPAPGHNGLWIPGKNEGESDRNSRVCVGSSANFSFANLWNHANRVPFADQIADFEVYQPEKDGVPEVDAGGNPVYKTRNVKLKPEFEFQVGSADGGRSNGIDDEGKSNSYLAPSIPTTVVDGIVGALKEREDYAWITLSVLREVLRYKQPNNRGGVVNDHFRSGLAGLL